MSIYVFYSCETFFICRKHLLFKWWLSLILNANIKDQKGPAKFKLFNELNGTSMLEVFNFQLKERMLLLMLLLSLLLFFEAVAAVVICFCFWLCFPET